MSDYWEICRVSHNGEELIAIDDSCYYNWHNWAPSKKQLLVYKEYLAEQIALVQDRLAELGLEDS